MRSPVPPLLPREMTATDLGLHPDFERRMEHEKSLDATLARLSQPLGWPKRRVGGYGGYVQWPPELGDSWYD